MTPEQKEKLWSRARDPEQAKQMLSVLEQLVRAGRYEAVLDSKTDVEIAAYLDDIAGEASVLGPAFGLLQGLAARLRRAGGGPLPSDEGTP